MPVACPVQPQPPSSPDVLPLLHHDTVAAVFARTLHGPVPVSRFLHDVAVLEARFAAEFPGARHVLNVCQDRYHFAVGLAAAMLSGRISLLPATHTPEMIRQLCHLTPDVFCLRDAASPTIDLPDCHCPPFVQDTPLLAGQSATDTPLPPVVQQEIPTLPVGQVVARVFTSGSTGTPMPHDKTWGALVRNVRAEAARLGLPDHPPDRRMTLVGTVPPQHMYGFESTVLLAFHGHAQLFSGRPFYPADIATALAAVPAPRLLVTTPFHLRALLAAGLPELPHPDLLLSATAPLPLALAREAENVFHAPLLEIYGCTESGQIASRRPLADPAWMLLQDLQLRHDGQYARVSGGHVPGEIALGDAIECLDETRFLLHGRHEDLINIAGKRTSLAWLNHQINAIDGVEDAAFFMPDEAVDTNGETTAVHVTRLLACVVAPTLDTPRLLQALRQRIDPVFLPRPLLFVDALPRNETGKLPRPLFRAFIAGQPGLLQTTPSISPANNTTTATPT